MSTLKTTDDLRADALFRAGESPTDTTGSFWTKSLEYLNDIQQSLLLGGAIAEGRDLATSAGIYAHLVDLPITDWWWARKRGVFNTSALVTGYNVSGTLTQGTTQTITTTADVTQDVLGWYVVVEGQPTVYRVARRLDLPTEILLDQPYVDDTIADAGLTFAKIEYDLAPDFLRFCSTPYRHASGGMTIDVGSIQQRNDEYTQPFIRQGRPSRAFMVGPRKIAVNGYDIRPYRFEYEYIAMPPDMKASQQPALPEHHRAVLSSGAAMMMLFDKDDSRAANMASKFRELVGRMVQEHRRALAGGSSTFGQFRFRRAPIARRSPQPLGELYVF